MTAPPPPSALARRLLARPIDPAAHDVVELAAWVLREYNVTAVGGDMHEGPAGPSLEGHLHLLASGAKGAQWAFQDGRYVWTDRWGRRRVSPYGTRLLRSGDHLTIYPDDEADVAHRSRPPTGPLWSGVVDLQAAPGEGAVAAPGEGAVTEPGRRMAIGTITWRGWFLQQLPAELRPA